MLLELFFSLAGREDGDVVRWTDNTGVGGRVRNRRLTYLEMEGIVFVLETSRGGTC